MKSQAVARVIDFTSSGHQALRSEPERAVTLDVNVRKARAGRQRASVSFVTVPQKQLGRFSAMDEDAVFPAILEPRKSACTRKESQTGWIGRAGSFP